MSDHTIKTYLLETEYTNYNVKIKYNGVKLNSSIKFKDESDEIKYLYDKARGYEIFLGGTEYCTSISIFSKQTNIANINNLDYNKKCNIAEDLESGIGTRHIFNTSMNFILLMFPNITAFTFNDASTKACNKTHAVSLLHYYLVFYGETWYSKTFHAYLKKDTPAYKELQSLLTKLQDSNTKKTYTFFYNKYLTNKDIQDKIIEYDVENIYNSSDNYSVFFSKLKDNIGNKAELCIFVSYFLTNLVNNTETLSVFANWFIDKDTVTKIDINLPIKPFTQQTGGKRIKYYSFANIF